MFMYMHIHVHGHVHGHVHVHVHVHVKKKESRHPRTSVRFGPPLGCAVSRIPFMGGDLIIIPDRGDPFVFVDIVCGEVFGYVIPEGGSYPCLLWISSVEPKSEKVWDKDVSTCGGTRGPKWRWPCSGLVCACSRATRGGARLFATRVPTARDVPESSSVGSRRVG